jgi:hypothetical protein
VAWLSLSWFWFPVLLSGTFLLRWRHDQRWFAGEKGDQAFPGPGSLREIGDVAALSPRVIQAGKICLHGQVESLEQMLLLEQARLQQGRISFPLVPCMRLPPVRETEEGIRGKSLAGRGRSHVPKQGGDPLFACFLKHQAERAYLFGTCRLMMGGRRERFQLPCAVLLHPGGIRGLLFWLCLSREPRRQEPVVTPTEDGRREHHGISHTYLTTPLKAGRRSSSADRAGEAVWTLELTAGSDKQEDLPGKREFGRKRKG